MTEKWTATKIPDLTGKVIIITGANSGIGYEAAKELTRKGAQTILACRNMTKAESALASIKAEIPHAPVEVTQLNLASLASVRRFAEAFQDKYKGLDVLVNNAGIMAVPYAKTADGFESQFGVNHLGHFALTGLLIDVLLATRGSRVVNISSLGHRRGANEFITDPSYQNGAAYSPMQAYGNTKLANLLYTYELQRRFQARGADALAVAAHPGISETGLADHMIERWHVGFLKFLIPLFLQSAAMGALPTLRAAVEPGLKGGEYFGPDGKNERRGYPVIVHSNAASHNEADGRRLWEISQELTGVRYL